MRLVLRQELLDYLGVGVGVGERESVCVWHGELAEPLLYITLTLQVGSLGHSYKSVHRGMPISTEAFPLAYIILHLSRLYTGNRSYMLGDHAELFAHT